MTSELAISAKHITKRYDDKTALNDLTLSVNHGEIFGLLGHNGAGKTTTVSILTTLTTPTSGEATINGFDIQSKPKQVRQSIGYLPESVQFYEYLTVFENLDYLAKLSGLKNPRNRILEVLEFLEFEEHLNERISTFSKGMKQRVGIGQAILHSPQVLFLDEPTSGLDPEGVIQLRELITLLNHELGMTIFMNTHLLSEVTKLCTQIGILKNGTLIYQNSLVSTIGSFDAGDSLEDIYFKIDGANSK
ncbi:MAG: ABC transporter ATP-binding protein [Actinobacteria bacterium]|nr:ABC transporter ATP-binding protein [Actinomycetota bacterium]